MTDVFIVSRDEPALHEYLKQHFADRPDVEVILDRRVAERRRRAEVPRAERRTGGRRGRSVEGDLAALGFAVVLTR
jgi:hypothetical protein